MNEQDQGFNGQVYFDSEAVEQIIVEKVWENAETNGNVFCWNCGTGTGRKKQCPVCGAITNGKARFQYPHAPHMAGVANLFHPSIMKYQMRTVIFGIIFGIIMSVAICYGMYYFNDMTLDEENMRHMSYVLVIIWVFWLAKFIFDIANLGRKIRAATYFNRTNGGAFICAVCEAHTHYPANYCGLCGCVIPK